jgi:hypothetical protein
MTKVLTGLENLIDKPRQWITNERIGILCNPASVDRHLTHTRRIVDQVFPEQLKALYSPQHGFFAEKQDNMIESENMVDPVLKIPIYSLYGKTRIPEARMFEPIDVLLVDLQDVGTRVYTFIYTLSYCLCLFCGPVPDPHAAWFDSRRDWYFIQRLFCDRLRSGSRSHEGLEAQYAVWGHRPTLGCALTESPHARINPGLPGSGTMGRHQCVGRTRHHSAL